MVFVEQVNDGEVVADAFVIFAKKIYGDDDEDAIATAEEISNECVKIAHDDRCELAVLLMECAKTVIERHASSAEETK